MKKKRLWVILLVCIMALSIFAFAACTEEETPQNEEPTEVTITLNPTSLSLAQGGAKGNITATVTGTTDNPTWTIDVQTVATIVSSAKMCQVTPVGEGTATVTAAVGGKTATCTVNVSSAAAAETVTIKDSSGAAVTTLSLERTDTAQLTAVASKGSPVTWVSTDTTVATVVNGLVTALKPGTTTIRAAVSSSVKAEFTLTVTKKAGDVIYDLKASDGNGTWNGSAFTGSAPADNEFYYWASFDYQWLQCVVTVNDAYFENGKLVIDYSGNDKSNGMQVHLKKNSLVTAGHYYKLTAKVNTDTAGWVNINETPVQLAEGDNNVTVYFHAATANVKAFTMFMGKEGSSTEESELIKRAHIEISDIVWTEDTERVQLTNPTFSITSGVITITDSNPAGSVAEYRLGFFQSGEEKGSVAVKSGEAIDISAIDSGEYTVEIKVSGTSSHYINTDYSSTNTAFEVVNAAGRSYTAAKTGSTGAVATPGDWTFSKEDWVYPIELSWNERDQFAPKFADSKLTAGFANNESTWYALQMFYQPRNTTVGTYYQVKLNITLDTADLMIINRGNAQGNEGTGAVNSATTAWVTICGTPVEISTGTHEYTVYAQAAANTPLVSLVMSKDDSASFNRISKATIHVADPAVTEAVTENLAAPTFTWNETTKTINISDTNAAAKVAKYVVGFFAATDTDTPSYTIDLAAKGEHALNLATVGAGSYTIKVKAVGAAIIYNDSAYAGNDPASTVTIEAVKLTVPTFTYNASSKEVTVSDSANAAGSVSKYLVGLFEDANATPTYTFDVTAKDTATAISLTKVFAGTYTIKVKAVGAGASYPDSDWAVNTTPDTVTSDVTKIDVVCNNTRGEDACKTDPGEWYVWTPYEDVTASYDKNNAITVKYTLASGDWYGVQIFYRDASIAAGTYTVTMDITVSKACNIKINGTEPYALNANENPGITLNEGTYVHVDGSCTVNIQLGTSTGGLVTDGGNEVTFTISNVVFTPKA